MHCAQCVLLSRVSSKGVKGTAELEWLCSSIKASHTYEINFFQTFTKSALDRFGLVVAMSMYMSVPFHVISFASMDWCGASLVHGLVWSVRRPRVEP